VQLYVKRKNRREEEPLLSLKNFKRVWLKKGASAKISFTLTNKDLEYWDASSGRYLVYPDEYEIFLGASSANPKLHTRITVTGN
jgi:beta-glucosidase